MAQSRENSGWSSALGFPSGGMECLPKTHCKHRCFQYGLGTQSAVTCVDRGHSQPGPMLMRRNVVNRDPTVTLNVERKDRETNGHGKLKSTTCVSLDSIRGSRRMWKMEAISDYKR